jgi:HEAT repeat protein
MRNFVSEPDNTEAVDPDELSLWLTRLRHSQERNRVQAASELSRMRIRARGTVRTRGTLHQAASTEFPASLPDALQQILTILQQDQSAAVRREVAAALGEWGDETAVEVLRQMTVGSTQDADERVRRACVRALGVIGGPAAAVALCEIAEQDPSEAIRRDAISAVTDLGLKNPPIRRVTRGATRVRGDAAQTQRVLQALQRITQDDTTKGYLRYMAEAGLNALQHRN